MSAGPRAVFIRDSRNQLWLPLTDPTVCCVCELPELFAGHHQVLSVSWADGGPRYDPVWQPIEPRQEEDKPREEFLRALGCVRVDAVFFCKDCVKFPCISFRSL